jgi:O-antigen/teichoic acid export membrane protein
MRNIAASILILKKNELIRNTFILSFGIGASQIVAFITQLIIRRLFTPVEFGAFDVYFNIFGILVVFAALRYEMSIILPKKDGDASNLVVLAILFSFAFSILIFLLLLFFRNSFTCLLGFPDKYSEWLLLLPLTTFFFSSSQIINYWLIRKKVYSKSSFNKIIRRAAEGTTQVSFGILKNSFGLVIGDLCGNLLNFIMGLKQLFNHSFSSKSISKDNLIYVFKRYFDFPKYNLIPGLLNTLSTALPFLIINKFYGGANTGYFGLSKMILAIPIAIISTAISQVLLQQITEKRNLGISIKPEFNRIAFNLGCLGLTGILIFSIWGVELLTFLFDETWKRSGEFIQIIVFASAINFVVSPLSIIFVALEKLKAQAIWQTSYFLLILSLFLFKNLPIEYFLYVYVAIDILSYIAYFFLIEKVLSQYEFSRVKVESP